MDITQAEAAPSPKTRNQDIQGNEKGNAIYEWRNWKMLLKNWSRGWLLLHLKWGDAYKESIVSMFQNNQR